MWGSARKVLNARANQFGSGAELERGSILAEGSVPPEGVVLLVVKLIGSNIPIRTQRRHETKDEVVPDAFIVRWIVPINLVIASAVPGPRAPYRRHAKPAAVVLATTAVITAVAMAMRQVNKPGDILNLKAKLLTREDRVELDEIDESVPTRRSERSTVCRHCQPFD